MVKKEMFARLLKTPNRSLFLFGPWGTGKSTWLQQSLPEQPILKFHLRILKSLVEQHQETGVLCSILY